MEKCLSKLIEPTAACLDKWFCEYVHETRPKESESIHTLLCGILGDMKSQILEYPNFLKKDDPAFHTFHVTLKNICKIGIGSFSLCLGALDRRH